MRVHALTLHRDLSRSLRRRQVSLHLVSHRMTLLVHYTQLTTSGLLSHAIKHDMLRSDRLLGDPDQFVVKMLVSLSVGQLETALRHPTRDRLEH